MRLGHLVAAVAMLTASLAAHADDLFVFHSSDDTLSFTLPSSPVVADYEDGVYFKVLGTSSLNGKTSADQFIFFPKSDFGGFDDYKFAFASDGTQLYSGPESAPTFTPGTYALRGATEKGTLTISVVIPANAPEISISGAGAGAAASLLFGCICILRGRRSSEALGF